MKNNMNTNIRNSLLLFLTACIWGVAFVAQSVGMDYLGPYTFNFLRFIIGGVVLIPFILWREHAKKRDEKNDVRDRAFSREASIKVANETENLKRDNVAPKKQKDVERRVLVRGGIACGLALCIASTLQQIGITVTSAGKSGFITALYIVLVPVLGLFLKKKVKLQVWIGVCLSVVGLYLLCIKDSFTLGRGDIYLLLCALGFAIHILVVDYFSPKTDGVKMSCIQFFVAGAISGVGTLLFEHFDWSMVVLAAKPVLYAGVMSCGVGYTLQIIGQKGLNPTVASLIMSLESVISVIAGFFILQEILSMREIIGCVFMFVAIVFAQVSFPEKKSVVVKLEQSDKINYCKIIPYRSQGQILLTLTMIWKEW